MKEGGQPRGLIQPDKNERGGSELEFECRRRDAVPDRCLNTCSNYARAAPPDSSRLSAHLGYCSDAKCWGCHAARKLRAERCRSSDLLRGSNHKRGCHESLWIPTAALYREIQEKRAITFTSGILESRLSQPQIQYLYLVLKSFGDTTRPLPFLAPL